MRLTALLSALLLAFVLSGCQKKTDEAKEKKAPAKKEATDKKAEKQPAAEPHNEKAEEAAEAAEAAQATAEEAAQAAEAGEAKAEEAAESAEAGEAKVEETAQAAEAGEAKAEEAAAPAESGEAKAGEAADKTPAEKTAPEALKKETKEDLQARRTRIQDIYKLGRTGKDEDLKQLQEIITGDGKPYEKATAIRALGKTRHDDLVEALKELATSPDLAVKSEAAILLYQWGEKEFSKPLMEEMLDQGVALRRAFFKGLENGKYVYEDEAKEFFLKAMDAKQIHVQLDAALGLLHMGDKEAALKAFADAMADKDKEYVRLTAVSYLASARDIPEAKALLEQAANDESPRVANRAKQILGTK